MVKITLVTILLWFVVPLQAQYVTQQPEGYEISEWKRQLTSTKDDLQKDTLLQQLIDAYIWNRPDSALFFAQQKILLTKKMASPQLEAYSTGYYGYILGLTGNYPQAVAYLLKGLQIAEKTNDKTKLDFFYDALSNTYIEQGNFERALYYANLFQDISIQKNDTLMYGWLLTKGVLYEKVNQPDSALFYLQKAYSFDLKENGEITRSRILLTLGDVHFKKGNYPLALELYHKTITAAVNNNHHINMADAFNGIAKLYSYIGQIDSSVFYAYYALQLSQSTSYALGRLTAYNELTELYKKNRNSDSTIKYLEASIKLKDSLFNQEKERAVQNLSFAEQLRQRDIIEAEQQYRNKVKVYGLIAGFILILIIAAILYHNIQIKQKAYTLLHKQKEETEKQKAKTEQAYTELKATQNQLIQREKMASLGELTSGIAHEIQNPLNFVNNFSDVSSELLAELKDEIKEGDKEEAIAIAGFIEQNLSKINHHGRRADAIVKGMLQHSRVSTGEKQSININALADEYLRLSYHGIRAKDKAFHVQLQTHFDPSIEKINAVPQDIGRVLLNLFNNAFYSMNEKKKQLNGTYEPLMIVSTKMLQKALEIQVRDNGTGIPQKHLNKIYQPFFTTKPTGVGTGLGLFLSYDIVTKGHGGEIKVETKEGEYTAFKIWLPV